MQGIISSYWHHGVRSQNYETQYTNPLMGSTELNSGGTSEIQVILNLATSKRDQLEQQRQIEFLLLFHKCNRLSSVDFQGKDYWVLTRFMGWCEEKIRCNQNNFTYNIVYVKAWLKTMKKKPLEEVLTSLLRPQAILSSDGRPSFTVFDSSFQVLSSSVTIFPAVDETRFEERAFWSYWCAIHCCAGEVHWLGTNLMGEHRLHFPVFKNICRPHQRFCWIRKREHRFNGCRHCVPVWFGRKAAQFEVKFKI